MMMIMIIFMIMIMINNNGWVGVKTFKPVRY